MKAISMTSQVTLYDKEFHHRKPTDLRRDEKILRDSGYDVIAVMFLHQSTMLFIQSICLLGEEGHGRF